MGTVFWERVGICLIILTITFSVSKCANDIRSSNHLGKDKVLDCRDACNDKVQSITIETCVCK